MKNYISIRYFLKLSTMSIILLILFYIFTSITPCFANDNNANYVLLYTLEGRAYLIDENFRPVMIKFQILNDTLMRYEITSKALLEYVRGSPVYENLSVLLQGVDRVSVESSCDYIAGNDSVKVFREGRVIRIVIPAGPCITDELPVRLSVSGAVYVANISGDTVKVRVELNLSVPFVEGRYLVYVPIVSREFSWIEDLFRGAVLRVYTEYLIRGRDIYQDDEHIGYGFLPFYIAFPRNATEVREVIEKNINVSYLGYPIKVSMERRVERIPRYGGIIEVRNYSIIIASLFSSQLQKLVSDITSKLQYPITYMWGFMPSILENLGERTGDIERFIVDTLLGEKTSYGFGYIKSSVGVLSPYGVIQPPITPDPVTTYIYSYPLGFGYMPIRVKLTPYNRSSVETVARHNYIYMLIEAGAEYEYVDPYSIDVGFYEAEYRALCQYCWLRIVIPIAIVIVAVAAFVLYRWLRR